MKIKNNSWERTYKKRPTIGYGMDVHHHPEADYITGFFADNEVRKILDLGCGDGGNIVYYAKHGFKMHGLDYAPTALKLAKKWLSKEGFKAKLKCGDMTKIPWPDGYFDAVISIMALDHNTFKNIQKTIAEVYRVLRKKGYFYATVLKYSAKKIQEFNQKRKTKEIEYHTYIPSLGHDRGVPHHRFTIGELKKLLNNFKLIKITAEKRFTFLAQKP